MSDSSSLSSRNERYFLYGSTLILLGAIGLMISINTLRDQLNNNNNNNNFFSSGNSDSSSYSSSLSSSSISPIRWLASSIDPIPINNNNNNNNNNNKPYSPLLFSSYSNNQQQQNINTDNNDDYYYSNNNNNNNNNFELEDISDLLSNYSSSSSSTGSGFSPGTVPGNWASGFYYTIYPDAKGDNRTVCDINKEWKGIIDWEKYEESPPICIVIGLEKIMYKTIFRPKVDEFSLLSLDNSYNRSEWYDCSARIAIEIGDMTTGPKARFSQDCRIINPFWGIIIKLNNGIVSSIDWDEDCSLCSDDKCIENFCGIELNECDTGNNNNNNDKLNCDIKIYTSWKGTDIHGNVLTSSGKRLSQFRRWSLGEAYKQAAKSDLTDLPLNDPVSGQSNRFST